MQMAFNTNSPLFQNERLAQQLLNHETENDKIKTERGWLGSIWGNSSSIPNNIAALLLVFSLITGIIFTICSINIPQEDKNISIKDFWSIISPFITLPLGYLFGIKKKE